MPVVTTTILSQLIKPIMKEYSKGHKKAFGPALSEIEKTHGKKTRKKVEASTHTYGVSGPGSGFSAKFKKGGKIRDTFKQQYD